MSRSPVAERLVEIASGARRVVDRVRRTAAIQVRRSVRDGERLDPAAVTLVRAGPERRAVLHNLVQLYRHDLSEFRGYELDEDGTYAYGYLDRFLAEPGREAFLVRADGHLAGFVFTNRLPDGVWQVSELFVVRPYRRRGLGSIVLSKTLDLHPGRWTCFVDDLNEGSQRMCSGVVDQRAEQARSRRVRNRSGFVGTSLRFEIPEPNEADRPGRPADQGRSERATDPAPAVAPTTASASPPSR